MKKHGFKPRFAKNNFAGLNPFAVEFADKLQLFQQKFGNENGAKWCAQGLTYVEALERQCDLMQAELDQNRAHNEELKARLVAVGRLN
jgi:hypothetical protein